MVLLGLRCRVVLRYSLSEPKVVGCKKEYDWWTLPTGACCNRSVSGMIVLISPTANTGSLEIGDESFAARLFMKRIMDSGNGTDSHLSLVMTFMVFRTKNFTLPDSDPVG